MKKWEKFSKEEIKQFVACSSDYNELAVKIGYGNVDANNSTYRAIVNMIDELSLDASHLKNEDFNFDYDRFKYGAGINKVTQLQAISDLRGRKCEMCGLEEWFDEPIALEIHHIDGDRLNNTLDNLQLLCPNCHAMTDNWRGRGKKAQHDIVEDMGIYTNIYRSGNKTKDGIYKYYATCKICGAVVERKLDHIKRNQTRCYHKSTNDTEANNH